jgi:ribosomal protein L40E
MPEILTESFCERCGTRYTFESGAPRGPRLKGVKVLSRGLKNFVMSDDTSLDEAMAAARSESDREVTTHQLDAFHKTFNFCMSCRQYTCGNCWNEAEGQCLSCAPHLGHDILQAPFPHLDPATGLATDGANGGPNGAHEPPIAAEAMAWPTSDLLRDDTATAPVASGFEATAEADATPDAPVLPADDVPAWDRLTAHADEYDAGEIAGTGFDAGEDLEPIDAAARLADIGAMPAGQPPATLAPAASDVAEDPDDRAAAAAEQTTELLQRFRPGQSLDDELAAFERDQVDAEAPVERLEAAAPEPEPEPVIPPEPAVVAAPEPVVAAAPQPVPEPEPVVAAAPEPVMAAAPEPVVAAAPEPEPEPEPVVAAAPEPAVAAAPEPEPEPEPVVAAAPEPVVAAEPEPEPVAAATPEPEPEPVAAAPPEPEPVVAPQPEPVFADEPRHDVVEQPTWRIVAPDVPAPNGEDEPVAVPPPGPFRAPAEPVAASAETQWPDQPEWPAERGAGGLPSYGRPAVASGGIDQLWAESAREVIAAPVATAARSGVQACVSCGLSLSATARFCRRCGTRQG